MARKKSNKEKLFSIRNYSETILWIFAIVFAIIGTITFNILLIKLSTYILFFIGFSKLLTYLYFKKALTFFGYAKTGRFAFFWTIGESIIIFLLGYYIISFTF